MNNLCILAQEDDDLYIIIICYLLCEYVVIFGWWYLVLHLPGSYMENWTIINQLKKLSCGLKRINFVLTFSEWIILFCNFFHKFKMQKRYLWTLIKVIWAMPYFSTIFNSLFLVEFQLMWDSRVYTHRIYLVYRRVMIDISAS